MPIDPRPCGSTATLRVGCSRYRRAQSSIRLFQAALVAWLLSALAGVPARAAQPGGLLFSAPQRDEARQAIPFDELTNEVQEKLGRVVGRPSIFRRLPAQVIDCDPDLYVFLVRYPEITVNIWQLLDITKVQLKRTGPYSFEAADGAGTVSKVDLVYGRPDLHVFYAEGYYEGPLFRHRLDGSSVLLLRSNFTQRDGRVFVTCQLDTFIQLENGGLEVLAKTLQPVMGKTADYNFVETVKFVSQISAAAERNAPGMERLANRLNNVDPAVRESFIKHTLVVNQRALLRQNVQATPSLLEPRTATPATALQPVSPYPAEFQPRPDAPTAATPTQRR
jgi:hypothetical protein